LCERDTLRRTFLANAGWPGAGIAPLAGDASFRRYYRLRANGLRAVLMDAPPSHENVRPFVRIARQLRALGFSAPAILAADEALGFLLLEDFGDDTFSRLLRTGAAEQPLYRLAVDVLIRLHTLPAAVAMPSDLPTYDERRLLDEALLLTDWFLPAVTGRPTPADVREAYAVAWRAVLPAVLAQPATLVLRDFHVDNLMRLGGRAGIAACGLLDFQDAVAGSPAYDLMSLLEDARRDVPDAIRAEMLNHYADASGLDDRAGFTAAFAVLAAQRHAKVIGIFTRLDRRDGKPIYLGHIPRVWRLLERALADPALAPVAAWFARFVPAELRRIPTAEHGHG
jgi:aminoglycoside/choline kinase family phosphotransferase